MSEFSINQKAVKARSDIIKNTLININSDIAGVLRAVISVLNSSCWSGQKAEKFLNEFCDCLLSSNGKHNLVNIIEKTENIKTFLNNLETETSKTEKEVNTVVKESTKTQVSETPKANSDKVTAQKIVFGETSNLWNLAEKMGYKGYQWKEIFRDANGNEISEQQAARLKKGDIIYFVGTGAAATKAANELQSSSKTEVTTPKKSEAKATSGTIKKTVDIPKGYGTEMTYMSYQMVTSSTAEQGKFRIKLEQNGDLYYDKEGFARVKDPEGDRYVIACTTTYGKPGDKIDFVLSDGTVIKCVMGDIKDQNDAGCNSYGHNNGKCVVEFCVNGNGKMRNGTSIDSSIPKWYKNGKGNHANAGTSKCHPEWSGNPVKKAKNYGSYY